MPLKGEAKKIYQREYMRKRRAGNTIEGKLKNVGIKLNGNKVELNVRPVRPKVLDLVVRPELPDNITGYDADGYPIYDN